MACKEKCGDLEEDDFSYNSLMKGVIQDGFQSTIDKNKLSRFSSPVSESKILAKIDRVIPKATRKSTIWSVNTWQEWSDHHQSIGSEFPPKLDEFLVD